MHKKTRFSLLVFAATFFIICGVKMYLLADAQQLWGYWILGFIGFGWLTWLMATLPLYVQGNNARWFLLSILSGFLFVGGFPNSPLTPLMFIAFVPLLVIADEIKHSEISIKKRLFMRYAYNSFVIWNIGSTWWVGNAGLIPGLIANFLNAFFMTLPLLLFYIANTKFSKLWAGIALIGFWFSWEILHLSWELSWPWLTIGNAFAQHPDWIQWYEYTGVFGGGLWILILNLLIFRFNESAVTIRKFVPIALALITPLLCSFFIKYNYKNDNNDWIEVVAVQPNFEPHYVKFELSDELQLERFLQLSKAQITPTTDYLVYPETSFGYFDVDKLRTYPIVQQLSALTDSTSKLRLISGLDLFKIYAPSENLPKSVRKTKRGLMEIYNGAVQITAHQSEIPYYKKGKMVPGAEAFPFRWLFGFLEPLFHQFNGTVEGLGTQPERSVFWSQDQRVAVAPLICYESIYGGYCTDYVKKGANVLFIMTNDGWWDDTPGYIQHFKFASLRAIELRRSIARSANSGTSAFFDELGHSSQATAYDTPTAIKEKIQLNNNVTFYAKHGDYLAWMGVLVAACMVLAMIVQYFRNKITP